MNRALFIAATMLCLPSHVAAQSIAMDPEGLLPESIRQQETTGRILGSLAAGRQQALSLASAQKEPWNYFWSGYIRLRFGDTAEAIRDLRESEKQGLGAESAKTLAAAYYVARQYALFRQTIRRAMDADPRDPFPFYYLGRHLESDKNDLTQAEECFRQAIERFPAHVASVYHLGYIAETRGEWDSAARFYRTAADLAEKQSGRYGLPLLGLARVEQRLGNSGEALRLARRALQQNPRDPEAQRGLAKTCAALGQDAEAVEAWERVAELDTTDPAPHYQLYRLQMKLGQKSQAEKALAHFRELRDVYGDR